jgi:hypothetical protein
MINDGRRFNLSHYCMDLKELLNSKPGKYIVSVLLGLGFAVLFQESCKDKECIRFTAPKLSDIDGKTHKFSDKCYRYDLAATSYDSSKKQVSMS